MKDINTGNSVTSIRNAISKTRKFKILKNHEELKGPFFLPVQNKDFPALKDQSKDTLAQYPLTNVFSARAKSISVKPKSFVLEHGIFDRDVLAKQFV